MSALALEDAKRHLNITSSDSDAELQETIDAAEAIIGNKCGPLAVQEVTRRVTPGWSGLVLPVAPVISLTSVTGSAGGAVDLADLTLDAEAGVITGAMGAVLTDTFYDVTYVAGWAGVPGDLLYAVKEMTRHLWRTQRGAGGRPGAAGPDTPAANYLVPYAVAELIAPYAMPGLA